MLRPAELAMLLDGVDLASVRRGKRYQRPRLLNAAGLNAAGAS